MHVVRGLRACIDGVPRWRPLAQLWLGKSQYRSLIRCVTAVTRAYNGLAEDQVLVFCLVRPGQGTHITNLARLEVYLDRDLRDPVGEPECVGWFDLPSGTYESAHSNQPMCSVAKPFQDRFGQRLAELYSQMGGA